MVPRLDDLLLGMVGLLGPICWYVHGKDFARSDGSRISCSGSHCTGLVAIVWFTAFGVTAIDQVKNGVGALPDGITDVSLVLFQMLQNLPLAQITSIASVVLLIIFFVTSSDSGSLVIDSITAGGKLHAPIPQRIFWASMEGLVAIVLLVGGGAVALSSLQAGAITAGLPFAVVLLVCCISLTRGLMTEIPKRA